MRNYGDMVLKALAFDFGHTLVDERKGGTIPLESRPVHLMPGVSEVLPVLSLPMAVWANTRAVREPELRQWLDRAGIGRFFTWVVTSVDAGFRKPAPEFFDFALARCGLSRDELLFVGNQLNTDITGGEQYGIRTVWLAKGAELRNEPINCEAELDAWHPRFNSWREEPQIALHEFGLPADYALFRNARCDRAATSLI